MADEIKIRAPRRRKQKKPGQITYDWDKIQADWEDVVLSNREIAEKHGVSYDYMVRRAKLLGWKRGQKLNDRIEQRTQEKLAFGMMSLRDVNAENTEDAAVEAVADQMAGIIQGQRLDIADARALCRGLIGELKLRSLTEEQRNRIVDVICSIERDKSRATVVAQVKLFMASLDLPKRVQMMTQIANALETLIRVERLTHGLDAGDGDTPPYESALSELKKLSGAMSA